MPAESTTAPAAPMSFSDYIDKRMSGVELPDTAAEVPAAVVTPEPAAPAAVTSKYAPPEDITAALLGTKPDAVPAAVVDPVEDEKQLDDLFKTNAGQAFAKLKSDLKASRSAAAEVDKLKQELADARKAAAPAPELETLRAELAEAKKTADEYDRELAVAKVEASREYKDGIGKTLSTIRSTVGEIAKRASISEREIFAALEETDTAKQDDELTNIASSMSERDRLRLYGLVEQYSKTMQQDVLVKANAKAALDLLDKTHTEETAKQHAERLSTYHSAADVDWEELQKTLPIVRSVEGNDDWNKSVAEIHERTKNVDFDRMTPSDKARLAHLGFIAPIALELVKHYAGLAAQAQAQVSRTTKATPAAGGGAAFTPESKKPISAGGFLDAINAG